MTVVKLPTAAKAKVKNRVKPAREARAKAPWPKVYDPPWLREGREWREARDKYGEIGKEFLELTRRPETLILTALLTELPDDALARVAGQVSSVHFAAPSAATHDAMLLLRELATGWDIGDEKKGR